MIEGTQLVGRMSSFRMYNYCCMDGCDNLQLQLARDLKATLKLYMQTRDGLDEMKEILKMIPQQINDPEMNGLVKKLLEQKLQNAGDSTETSTSASGSNTETEGNEEAEVESLGLLEAAFRVLFDEVIEVEDKTLMLGPILGHLKSTLDCLKPLIEYTAQHNYNKALDRPKKEVETFGMQMKNGVELVRKCSKVHRWTISEAYKYTNQLFELDEFLQRQFSVLLVQVERDVEDTWVWLRNVREVVERIEGMSCEAKNQQLESDVVEVHETRDVRETTLASARNVEAELTLVDGGDGEVPETPSFTVGLDVPLEESKISDQKPREKENWMMKILMDGVSFMLDPMGLCTRKRARAKDSNMLGTLESLPREFSYRELMEATNEFDSTHVLGQGGYGVVYKGLLSKENLEVAVKRYGWVEVKNKTELLVELTIFNGLRHKHLIPLLGWYHDNNVLLIVYEYMPNGSLDKHLFSGPENATLGWSERYKIVAGVASALHYLHAACEFIVHKNIKASNIMLDSDFNARLVDFGLAHALDDKKTPYAELGPVPGTMGYPAPELIHTGKATCETDVYGFGAVILEIVSGQRPWTKIGGFQLFVDWVWSLHREGRVLEAVDERLGDDYDVEEAQRLLLLGLACSHPIAHERPASQTILQIISGSVPMPRVSLLKPAFVWPNMPEGQSSIANQ